MINTSAGCRGPLPLLSFVIVRRGKKFPPFDCSPNPPLEQKAPLCRILARLRVGQPVIFRFGVPPIEGPRRVGIRPGQRAELVDIFENAGGRFRHRLI